MVTSRQGACGEARANELAHGAFCLLFFLMFLISFSFFLKINLCVIKWIHEYYLFDEPK